MKNQAQTTARSRAVWLTISGLMLAMTAVLGGILTRPAGISLAATPASGRLTEANRTATWNGPVFTPRVIADRELCEVPGNCDEYELYLQLPSSYTNTQEISVTVSITGSNPADDYDLFVLDPEGNVSASSNGSTGNEKATIICPRINVTYTVEVVPATIISVNSTYSGIAQLGIAPGTSCNPNLPPPPGPVRDSGGISFGPNTLVDAQRQVGEPDIAFPPLASVNPFNDILASGPWGTATQQSFAWLSRNNGDTYDVINRIRPDVGPGGGDTSTEIDDQNYYYFTDLEGLVNTSAARSTDGGNTFTRSSAASYMGGVDRQWMAIDNGLTPAANDNTEFFTYRQAELGSFVSYSTDGQNFFPAQANPVASINSGAPCGDLRFDPVHRDLYLPCGKANQVEVARAHVDPGQRTGLVFTSTLAGNAMGEASNLFPVLATDSSGNVYVTYVDSADHNVYLTYSTNRAQTWSMPIRLNGNNANTTLFPWVTAGSDGRVAVAYIATDRYGDPDSFPSWYNDKVGSTSAKWYVYVNYVIGANTANPTIYQAQVSEHPSHYGQICTSGTLCLATGGDRTMADFLTLQHDNRGAIRIIYNDTTNQYHGASVFEGRQLTGPSLFATTLASTAPANPVSDPTNDAQFPHFSPTGPGPNYDALDMKGVGISTDNTNITVTMTISDLNASRLLPGASSVLWLTRWQSKSLGDGGEESHRIYYAGAKSTAGGAPSFFYGTGTVSAGPAVGCTDTTPQTCKLINYPAQFAATGTFSTSNGLIQIVVPRNGVGDPPNGSNLFSITGYTFGTRDTTGDFLDVVDVAKAFDYLFTNGPQPTPTPVASVTPSTTRTAVVGTPTTTPTVCPVQFQDVRSDNTFYPTIRCLACRGIMSGYPCGGPNEPCNGSSNAYFRPANNITRGQLSKIVSNSAGYSDTPTGQTFEDVPSSSPFYVWIQRLSSRGYIGGYPCGSAGEPCQAGNRPYFRYNSNASRGQISKIVSNAAGYTNAVSGQTYEDVPPSAEASSYYQYIERLSSRGVMGGYPCGSPGEPCNAGSKPYFRPNATATRGQTAKIDGNAFFPNCQTPANPYPQR